MSTPIVETMKNNQELFRWTDESKKWFQMLKRKIIEQSVLALPYFLQAFSSED